MLEISQRLLRAPHFAAYSDSDTLNFAIGFKGLTGTSIAEWFGEGSIDALNEGLRHTQSVTFGLQARLKAILYDIVNTRIHSIPT